MIEKSLERMDAFEKRNKLGNDSIILDQVKEWFLNVPIYRNCWNRISSPEPQILKNFLMGLSIFEKNLYNSIIFEILKVKIGTIYNEISVACELWNSYSILK